MKALPPKTGRLSWISFASALSLLIGLVLSAYGALQIKQPVTAQWYWFGAMLISCLGLLLPHLNRESLQLFLQKLARPENTLIPISLFVLALAVRIPAITESPPFLHGDEASCGIYGRLFNNGTAPLLSISWFDLPNLSYAISGWGMQIFGDNLTGLRTINAIIGSVGVVVAYALGRTLFGLKAGIIAGVVLVFGFLHATLSRDGIHYIQGPTAITFALLFFALTLKHGGRVYPLLCGFAFILCIQVYWSARIALLLVPFLLAWLVLQNRPLFLSRWRNFGWLILGVLIAGLPVIALFMSRPESFGGHQDFVLIFNPREGTQTHLFSTYETRDPILVVANQFMRTLLTFVNRADASLQIGYDRAMVDPVTAVLLALSALFGLVHTFKRWQYTLCTAWFFSVFVSGVLTIDPPWWPRLSAFLPALALLIGAFLASVLGLVQGWFKSRPAKAVPAFAVIVLLGVIGALNLRTIFVDFPAYGQKTRFIASTLLGSYLAKQPQNVHTLLLTDNSLYLESEAIVFLAPDASANGCTLRPDFSDKKCATFNAYDLFIIMPSQVANLDYLKKQFPDGKVEMVSTVEEHGTDVIAFKRY